MYQPGGHCRAETGEVATHARVARSMGSVPFVTVSRAIMSAPWQAFAEPGTVVGSRIIVNQDSQCRLREQPLGECGR